MKKQTPTSLEMALKAHVASVAAAKKKLEDEIQAAEDQHYADQSAAREARRKALAKPERIYDAAAKKVEAAWSKVFQRSLQESFGETQGESRADREALRLEAEFAQALPFIAAEVPADLPGLAKLLTSTGTSLKRRRIETGKALADAHDRSAKKSRKELPQAKRKREQGMARAKRAFEQAKKQIEADFAVQTANIDRRLKQAKAKAQANFDRSARQRKKAWADYSKALKAANQALLAGLS